MVRKLIISLRSELLDEFLLDLLAPVIGFLDKEAEEVSIHVGERDDVKLVKVEINLISEVNLTIDDDARLDSCRVRHPLSDCLVVVNICL